MRHDEQSEDGSRGHDIRLHGRLSLSGRLAVLGAWEGLHNDTPGSRMLTMVRDLFAHQAYADASMMNAIGRHAPAARDQPLRTLLHHVLLSHRFWIHLCQGIAFSVGDESAVPDSLGPIVARYQQTQIQERDWLGRIDEPDLARLLESPYFPARRVAVSEALVQVCLHSHGHRSQCATRLRLLGGEPPPLDFIVWLADRPAPVWE